MEIVNSSFLQMYQITGKCPGASSDIQDDFLSNLQKAVYANDMVRYGQLVNQNINILNGMESDLWPEIFHGGTHDEILFWIRYPGRKLTVHELSIIPFEYQDLFEEGLKRPDLDVDPEELEEAVGNLEERMDEAEGSDKAKLQHRIDQIEALLKREPPQQLNILTFNQIGQMVSQNQITSYDIDPQFQSQAGYGNTILKFLGRNGTIYHAKVRYDPQSKSILPAM